MSAVISSFLSPRDLTRIGRLTLRSRYVVEGTLAGRHQSHARGSGSEFADHRAYAPGDDLRRMDWKLLGRTDRYYVRRYEDETNLRVYLAVDRSASMGFGSRAGTKFDYARRLAAALGYVVVKARDSVGLYLYADRIHHAAGARNTFAHLDGLLRALKEATPASTTATGPALHQIADAIQRRAMIVLISDLFDDTGEVVKALAHFRRQHHDVIVFHTLDPCELDLDFRRGTEFEDLETGERVPADPRALAEEYRAVFGAFLESNRRACADLNIDYRIADTSRDPATFVRAYLDERKRLSK